MNMRPICVVLMLCMLMGGRMLYGQDFDHYQRLKCSGEIPAELLGSTGAKYKQRLKELEASLDADEQRAREHFLLESSFFLDGLLRGGSVLFNDPVSAYLNQIKDYVLKDDPELREKITVYTLRSPHVNAFATNEGVVLVTTGLVAHARNEATLAFVLCHEFQHYLQKHSMQRYVEGTRQKENYIFGEDEEERALASCRYSRDQEFEADSAGLRLFLNTSYGTAAVEDAYDLLLYAPYHYDFNSPWDKSVFESRDLRFPAAFTLDTVTAMAPDEFADDTHETHPSVGKRRTQARAHLGADSGRVGPLYVFGEEAFNTIRTVCRFEQSALYMEAGRYETSIYNSFLLLREYPKSFYLQRSIAEGLYALSRFRTENSYYQVHLDPEYVEGASQQMYHFFEEIERPVLNVLAVQRVYPLAASHPEDSVLVRMSRDLLYDLHRSNKEAVELLTEVAAPDQYFDTLPGFHVLTPNAARGNLTITDWEVGDDGSLQSVEGSEADTVVEISYPENYYQYALAGLFAQPAFKAAYAAAAGRAEADQKASEDEESLDFRAYRRKERREELRGKQLGLNKIVLISPSYIVDDEVGGSGVDRLASEQAKEEYRQLIQRTGKALNLDYTLLDPADLKKDEVLKFNDINAFKEYAVNVSTEDGVRLINMNQAVADSLAQKYGSDHFAFMYMISFKEKYRVKLGDVALTVVTLGAYLPFFAAKSIFPENYVGVVTVVYDLKKNNILMTEYRRVKGKATKTRRESIVYNSLYQIKTAPRKP